MSKNSDRQSNRSENFDEYVRGIIGRIGLYDFSDKESCLRQHIMYMLSRTQSMFKWSGLPSTIPERSLELYLQITGHCCFYSYEDNLYVFRGGLGGQPNVYYMPTIYTIANPALTLSKQLKIDEECVVVPNDCMYLGLIPLFRRYGTAIVENELSLKVAMINSRIVDLISSDDDRGFKSALKFLEDIEKGKLGAIAESAFCEGIKAQPYGSSSDSKTLTNLIENEQYLKASWFNELGLNSNYNMKREAITSTESQMNNDALLPLADNMLKCRKIAADKVNNMFGTDITVEFASSWEDNVQEIELEHKKILAEAEESFQAIGKEGEDDGNVQTE